MINKPLLKNATVVKSVVDEKISIKTKSFLSPAALEALGLGKGNRAMPGEDPVINETFVLKKHQFSDYHKYVVEGARTEFSLYRLVGGCNHLECFDKKGCEKSEDYDSIPSSRILDLPSDFEEAIDVINDKYIGRKLRIVARSAENAGNFENRYLLFSLED